MNSPAAPGYRPDAAASPDCGPSNNSWYAFSDSTARLTSIVAKYLAFRTFGDLRWSSFMSSTINLALSPSNRFRYWASSSGPIFPKGLGVKNIFNPPIFIQVPRICGPETIRHHVTNGKALPRISRSVFVREVT